MSRSTATLVDELRAVAVDEAIPFVAIIVGLERNTEFVVWSGDAAASLRELNEKTRRGGEAIGLAGFDLAPVGGVVRMRPFEEYADEEWIDDFLNALTADVKLIAEHLLAMKKQL
jgi:hypothetical protein